MRKGDTLRSIAQAVWGDANLWYLTAEANGLVGNESPHSGHIAGDCRTHTNGLRDNRP